MSWTEEEYQDFMKQRKSIHESVKPIQKKSKYHAQKVDKYGCIWDSRKELREYERLLLLQQAGEIKTIMLQPKFELQPSFIYKEKKQRAITYKADFMVVYTDGRKEIIEVKGFKTRDYVLRKKLLLYKYPDIDFVEIT